MALEDGEFRHSWQSTASLASNEMDVDALHSVLGRLKDDGTGVAATWSRASQEAAAQEPLLSKSFWAAAFTDLSSWPGFCTSKDDGPTWEIYAFAIEMFHTTASSTETGHHRHQRFAHPPRQRGSPSSSSSAPPKSDGKRVRCVHQSDWGLHAGTVKVTFFASPLLALRVRTVK